LIHAGREASSAQVGDTTAREQGRMRRPRRRHSAAFKAKVALAAIKGDRSLVELAVDFKIHPNQIGLWRIELLERAAEVFANAAERQAGPDLKALHAKIGEQALQIDLLSGTLHRLGGASAKR
jgi:transposase